MRRSDTTVVPHALRATLPAETAHRCSLARETGEAGMSVTLNVKLVGSNVTGSIDEVVKGATVSLKKIFGTHKMEGRPSLATEDTADAKPVGAVATFKEVVPGQYRIHVQFPPDKRTEYAANRIQYEVKAGAAEQTVTVLVGAVFKKVRFIGLCVAAVARQVWNGDAAQVVDYQIAKHNALSQVPDFTTRFGAYEEEFQNYWEPYKCEQTDWRVQYNGLPADADDIGARVAFLKSAISQAKAGLDKDSDTTLKVFMAPECFFLGRYGAYPYDSFAALMRELKNLVSGKEWSSWIFAFGTVNGFYELDGRLEMFNMSPVIRGGASEFGGDPDAFLKLMQKAMFSQEIPADGEVIPQKDDARTPLTEKTFSAGFQATENEEVIGRAILQILEDFKEQNVAANAKAANVTEAAARALRDNANQEIVTKGLYSFVRFIRGGEAEVKRKNAVTGSKLVWSPWMTDLKTLLAARLAKEPIKLDVAEGARVMDPRDFSFSCVRVPGPWQDDVVEAMKFVEPTLNFALEICADHLQGRFMTASQQTNAQIDIHLVPSAGAYLKRDSLGRLVEGGYAFNCDGWNCPSGSRVFERLGKVVLVEDELAPRQSGRNPLLPHTELWQAKSQAVKDKELKEWEARKISWKQEEDRAQADYKTKKAAYDTEWNEWSKKKQGTEPPLPQEPRRTPEPSAPVSHTYVNAGVKTIDLADRVEHILPYESASRVDKWKALEPQVKDTIARRKREAEEAAKLDKETRRAGLKTAIEKEANNLQGLEQGVTGKLPKPSLATLKQNFESAPAGPDRNSKQKTYETRVSQIKLSNKKLEELKAQLLALDQPAASAASAPAAASPDSFKLPAMQKLAVPQLHIYPEQDLPTRG
jgi:hypothetical protein